MPAPQLSQSRVLVLGAGWLGGALAEQLAAAGARVTTVRRSPHAPVTGGTAVAFDLTTLRGSTTDETEATDAMDTSHASPGPADPTGGVQSPTVGLPEALLGQDVVVALVAPDRRRGDDHASTYPAAAMAAVAIARAAGARALLWISSTGVYGYDDGREVTEATPRAADTPAQRALGDAEDTVLAAASPALRTGVLRVAGLYGPGRDPAGRYREPAALAGRSGQWLNLAWRDDVIAAIRLWSERALHADVPSVLNVADGTPLTVAECARLVARADGRAFVPPPDEVAPDAGGSGQGHAPPRAPSAPRSSQRIRVDALRALGWAPEVPHLRVGLLRLGYTRLEADAQPYGPQTAEIRAFLRELSMLSAPAHARVCARWEQLRGQEGFARADRALGETMVRLNREAERDAAAGPLMQMMRLEDPSRDSGVSANEAAAVPTLDPIAEPALAALMATLLRDGLPEETFALLMSPFAAADD